MNPSLVSRHRLHIARLVASLILSCCILPISSFAQTPAPQLIPFQGRLTNQAGVAYDNGQYTVTLNLYSLAIGGSTVWTERHEKVSVIGGMLNLFLGSIAPFDKGTASLTDDVDFSTTKYLGITVDADNNPATADPEMVPRTMIVTAFYAKNTQKLAGNDWSSFVTDSGGSPSNDPATGYLNAAKILPASITVNQIQNSAVTTAKIADAAISTAKIQDAAVTSEKIADGSVTAGDLSASLQADSLIPSGTVVAFAGTAAPVGWLICNGTPISRVTYSRLFSAIGTSHGNGNGTNTFHLPDYQGRFLRGLDAGTGRDAGPRSAMQPGAGGNTTGLGSVQNHSVQDHQHKWMNIPRGLQDTPASGSYPPGVAFYAINNEGDGGLEYTGAMSSGNAASETRPINAAVNYIIKY